MGPSQDLNLDDVVEPDGLDKSIDAFQEFDQTAVTVWCSLAHWDRVSPALCALRARGLSAVLLVRRGNEEVDDEILGPILGQLRDWDQLLLYNILELCGEIVPPSFLPALQQEAKIELKWFREWQHAIADPRVARYPGLPWRSFVRKVNTENLEFMMKFIALSEEQATSENRAAVDACVKEFLNKKKQVLCIFPKKWGGSA